MFITLHKRKFSALKRNNPLLIWRIIVVCFIVMPLLAWSANAHAQEMPDLYELSPQEGKLGSELFLRLEGEGFDNLGELRGVAISGLQVPVLDYEIVSNRIIEMVIELTEDIPVGETEISFLFVNGGFDAYFVVLEPDRETASFLYGVSPQEGQLRTEINLMLDGEGFFDLSELSGVQINSVQVTLFNYKTLSNDTIEVFIGIPENVPLGEGEISFFFENVVLDAYFVVLEPDSVSPPQEEQPHLYGIYPEEGELGTEVYLTLEGEGFDQLEDLDWVEISGVDIPLLDYDFISDQEIEVLLEIAGDVPVGEGEIIFIFENDSLENFFFVSEAQQPPVTRPPEEPTYWIFVLVLAVVGGGLIVWRILRPSTPKPKPVSPPANIRFKSKTDPGMQIVDVPGDSLTLDIDIHFVIKIDPGDQNVEETDSITG